MPTQEERIIDRLTRWMQENDLNDNQVTVACGLSVGLLNKARRGESDLGKAAIKKILAVYPKINRVWLLTGEQSDSAYGTDLSALKRTWLNGEVKKLVVDGRSKAQIARELNILPQALNTILNKNRGVTDEFIKKFSDTFRVPFTLNTFPPDNAHGLTEIRHRVEFVIVRERGDFFLTDSIEIKNMDEARGWANCISYLFPKYSVEWIMTGKGGMYTDACRRNRCIADRCRRAVADLLDTIPRAELTERLGAYGYDIDKVLDGMTEVEAGLVSTLCDEFGLDPKHLLTLGGDNTTIL